MVLLQEKMFQKAYVGPNSTSGHIEEDHLCKQVLYYEIINSRVRIWDVLILLPNFLFLLFLILRFNRARLKLRATSSPIFFTFYGLVVVNVLISIIRCVVSMTVNASAEVGGYADKILWITTRFFLLAMEISVVIFGLAFGHLDSRSSIQHVLLATSFISLAFTVTQGVLEILSPDESFHIPSKDYDLFGHGGMLFWFISSLGFSLVYSAILILPWTRLRDRLALPTRRSFYAYILFLVLLDAAQSAGSGLLFYRISTGLCIVDVTTYIYFSFLTPLVYHTFLREFFSVSQPSILFSYKAQVDDHLEDDTVSLPHQQSFSSLKTDSDYIYQATCCLCKCTYLRGYKHRRCQAGNSLPGRWNAQPESQHSVSCCSRLRKRYSQHNYPSYFSSGSFLGFGYDFGFDSNPLKIQMIFSK